MKSIGHLLEVIGPESLLLAPRDNESVWNHSTGGGLSGLRNQCPVVPLTEFYTNITREFYTNIVELVRLPLRTFFVG
jgi:hypothetical protein